MTPFAEYVLFLIASQRLMIAGKADGPEYEAASDASDGPWRRMTDDERDVAGKISEGLYALAEEAVEGERGARIAAEEELTQLKSAIESAGLFVNDYGHVMRSGEGHDQ